VDRTCNELDLEPLKIVRDVVDLDLDADVVAPVGTSWVTVVVLDLVWLASLGN